MQTRVNGAAHPRVASALNDLGSAALQQGRLEQAESHFTRMREVYREVYGDSHALLATATSNLASVFMARQAYARAEALYREAVAMYGATQGAGHLNTGIGRIKLGRALLRQQRYVEAELDSLSVLLLVAGHETTVNLIGNGTLALLRNPEQLRLLREDPSLAVTATEEALRYDPPVQFTMRIATEDMQFEGKTLRKGQQAILLLGAANRDPEVFERPDDVVIDREHNRHIAFGVGIHRCAGSNLARMEMKVSIQEWLKRIPDYKLENPDAVAAIPRSR